KSQSDDAATPASEGALPADEVAPAPEESQSDDEAAPASEEALPTDEVAPAPEESQSDDEAAPASEGAQADDEAAHTPGDTPTDAQAPEQTEAPSTEESPLTDVEITESDIAVTPVPQSKGLRLGGSIIFATVIGIFLISWYLAKFFAKTWRMQDHKGQYFVVLFSFLIALFSTIYGLLGHRMNLGIDLRGGSILVYEVTQKDSDDPADEGRVATGEKTIDAQTMDDLKHVLAERINQGGVREIQIQALGGNKEIMVTIPEADEAEVARIERKINEAGQLKFRILASTNAPEEKELIDIARRPDLAKTYEIRLPEPIGKDRIIIGGTWVPVDPTMVEDLRTMPDVITRESPISRSDAGAERDEGVASGVEVLVLELTDLYDVYGRHMARVNKSIGERGEPELQFEMNRDGAERMKHLTDRYKQGTERTRGRQLGIILNDSLYSAPAISNKIESRGVITFGSNLSEESVRRINRDVDDLLKVMKSGVLPAQLSDEPVTRMLTGPTLGEDTIRSGVNSVILGGIAVVVFMVTYYGFGGLVASFAVFMNLLLLMMVMLSLRAAFTLPGLAGLVLTIGMAVDANILIYERIRDELSGGATLRMAIRNGFSRAFTAIFDSNITTMLTAIILYAVGSEQIKGFGLTLFLGVLFNMFTATYVSRVIFETAERQGWIGKRCVYPFLPGLKPFPKTNIPFMSYKKGMISLALAVVLIGFVGLVARGKGIFDIDFVGGVQIQALFNEPKQIGELRSSLEQLPDLSVSKLSLEKDHTGNKVPDGCCFSISTSTPPDIDSEQYLAQVETIVEEAFGDTLVTGSFGFSDLRTEEVPVPGSIDNEMKNAVLINVSVEPAQAREVVAGYYSDRLESFLRERDVASLNIKVESVDPEDPKGTNVHNEWRIVFDTDDENLVEAFSQKVAEQVNGRPIFESSQVIGSSVAGYARMQGVVAIIGSLIIMIVYIGVRFKKLVFGFSASVALLYNVLCVLGFLALSKWLAPYLGFLGINEFKIGLPTVAAFLTLIGYSLNDTIVLFDRMREICGKNILVNEEIVDQSINQCLSRTILTGMTTLFVSLVLYALGGAGIHTFAFAMSLGIVVGTFSTMFIASPCLLWLLKTPSKKK
ncbi:MAG: protein translocase subunit SecD, partial [Thermoguttaceae bacterium]